MENKKTKLLAQTGGNIIGLNKYNSLRAIRPENRTDEQNEQIKAYESKGIDMSPEAIKRREDYEKRIRQPETPKTIKASAKTIYLAFKQAFKELKGCDFVENKETLENIKPIIYYFAKDERFFSCGNISNISKPSFKKGILLVGGYGNGKTSTMQVMEKLFKSVPGYSFKTYSTNEVVVQYEKCTGDHAESKRTDFERTMFDRVCNFDDLKTERVASNFGKVNLLKDVLEERYIRGTLTHGSCNFKEGFEGDLKESIREFGEKYGARLYDRMFEMFNIIEFKGNSFRK